MAPDGQWIIRRARVLMQAGQARSWSHALALAADEARAALKAGQSLQTPQTSEGKRVTAD